MTPFFFILHDLGQKMRWREDSERRPGEVIGELLKAADRDTKDIY